MDGSDLSIPDSQTDTDLSILEMGAVTITPTIPTVLEAPAVQIITEMQYPVLDRLPTRDIKVDEKEYTVIYEQTSYADGKIFGFRSEGEASNQTKLFQIFPSSNRELSSNSILNRINFKDDQTVINLIKQGERIVEHANEIRVKLKNTPVPLNDLKKNFNIGEHLYSLIYQPQESSQYIESAFQNTIKKLERRLKD